jgi:hypothetical protein
MENRIQVNGVWYVREDISEQEKKDIEVTYAMTCTYENDKYCWEAKRLMEDDGISYYSDIDIKFTDKREKPWKEEHWDNNEWMINVMNNESNAIEDAEESMCREGIKEFRFFLKKLEANSWLETS